MRPISNQAETQQRPQAVASLDNRTQLDRGSSGPWVLSVYPEAGEAVVVAAPPSTGAPDLDDWYDGEHDHGDEDGDLDEAEAAERQRQNWERANRRAFSESRRYLVANRLRYMWVLTVEGDGLHGAEGRAEIMDRVARFVRKMRRTWGEMAYWASPELHPDGHGWHVNLFVGRRLPHAAMQPLWGHGIVWVSDWTKNHRVKRLGLKFVDALRAAADYGCKYASKDWDAEQIGSHGLRYVAAEGYKPSKITVRVDSLATGFRQAVDFFGSAPASTWHSSDSKTWDGPTVIAMRWSEAKTPPTGRADDG